MREEPGIPEMPERMNRPDVNAALRVSILSVLWTVVSSILAVMIGLRSHTTVLVAFGAVGSVDAIGSVTLTYHFLHGLRHDQLSQALENVSHRVVLIGLLLVGGSAAVSGIVRWATGEISGASNAGVTLAAVSFVVLLVLSGRKQEIARRIASSALRSDGQLSAVGAVLAAVTLAGTVVQRWLSWNWADAVATTALGAIAMWLAVSTWRSEQSI